MLGDIKNPWLIYVKGFLFFFLGLLAAVLLVLEKPTVEVVLLLAVVVWSFCRFYYFTFYVIERYVDPGYRFAGLWSFAMYLLRKGRPKPTEEPPPTPPDPPAPS